MRELKQIYIGIAVPRVVLKLLLLFGRFPHLYTDDSMPFKLSQQKKNVILGSLSGGHLCSFK